MRLPTCQDGVENRDKVCYSLDTCKFEMVCANGNEQKNISENKFKILTLNLLRKDNNVAQELVSSEKQVCWSENQLFPGTFI